MDVYKNPLTGKYDPFPVVDTEIGRLAIFICVDLKAPEIPRVYSMKGADVVLHLTSGMSASDGRNVPMGVIEAALKTRAWDNAVYLVNSNWGPELGAYYPRARIAGWSNVFDYMGNELIRADHPNEQIITATVDIEACRRYREGYFRNPISLIRTELYAPYYNQPIYPSNTFLRDGPIEELLNEQQLGYFKQAMQNVKDIQDFYSEKDV
jgi:predicted amidohydrolase